MPRRDRGVFGCLQHAQWCLWHTQNRPQNEMASVSTRRVLANYAKKLHRIRQRLLGVPKTCWDPACACKLITFDNQTLAI